MEPFFRLLILCCCLFVFALAACESQDDYFNAQPGNEEDDDGDDDDDEDDGSDDDDDDDDDDGDWVVEEEEESTVEMERCDDSDYYFDASRGQCWTRPVTRTAGVTFAQAEAFCNELASSTGKGWHLPSIDELVTLFDGCQIDLGSCDYRREYQRLEVDASDPCYCTPDCYAPSTYREMIRVSNDGETRVETCDFAMISSEQITDENGQTLTCQLYLTGAVACDAEVQSYGCVRAAD
jgi:hypothetical protein